MSSATPPGLQSPYLERFPEQGGPVERIPVVKVPLTLGRAPAADHVVYSNPVSKMHASIIRIGDRYGVRDLHSTNGTFVNGRRVAEQVLEDGDIIHLANIEFCFRYPASVDDATARIEPEPEVQATQALPLGRPASLIRGAELLRELVRTEAVETLFQPIVDLERRVVIGYEALSRGTHTELSQRPDMLLALAEQCGMVIEVSQLFRRLAVVRGRDLPAGAKLFLNVHAREVGDRSLLESLAALPVAPSDDHPIVIEIPESSVTNVRSMAAHRDAFAKLGFQLAYDDFGAGQARLIELTDVPPAYLKLDRSVVDGIEARPRQEMIRALLSVTSKLGVEVIGECIETERVAALCLELGCGLGQGHLFGPPIARTSPPDRPAQATVVARTTQPTTVARTRQPRRRTQTGRANRQRRAS